MPVPLRTTYQKAEAKYNVTTEFPSLGLHSAAATGNVGLVEYALDHGQPINSVLDGVLPLHAACAGGNVQVVKLLIDNGADVNAPRLPRRYSNDKNRDASAPIVGTSGSTPLHFAAANGNTDVVTLLLLHGAHADRSDKHGVTPEVLAQQNGWLECAAVLQQWVLNKDKDLRERPSDSRGLAIGSREQLGSFGTEANEPSLSMRRRIQMKHSIDTALNRLRSSSVDPKQQSTSSTPPSSPFKSEYTFYPVPDSDDEGLSPLGGGARRPSLPQILYPSTSRIRMSSSPNSNENTSARRPRSAGTGNERDDLEMNTSSGRPSVGRRLGSKYSLLNIFKRAQSGESAETSQHIPVFSSLQTLGSTSRLSLANSLNLATSSPQPSSSTTNLSDHGASTSISPPFARTGFRFHRGSDASTRAASQPHTPQSSNGKSTGAVPSPPRPTTPLAADIHSALAQQQHRERQQGPHSRDRSRSRIRPEEISRSSPSPSSSPLTRVGLLRARGHTRDRSGSGGSLAGSPGYRGGAVFDDDVMVTPSENSEAGKAEVRPGILLAHRRLPSNGQGYRALRFDSTSGGGGSGGRAGKDGELDFDGRDPALRSSNSTNSLTGFRRIPGSPTLRVSEEDLGPDSAPDHVPPDNNLPREAVSEDDDDDFEYGRPLPRDHKPILDIMTLEPNISPIDASFASSSQSSLSPIISTESPTVEGPTSLINADFPFSINNPPLTFSGEPDPGLPVSELLRIPPPIDNRSRGDSVSSTSSYNPQLSMSGTTSGSAGSDTVTTPLLAATGVPHIRSSPKRNEERLTVEGLQEEGLRMNDLKSGSTGVTNGVAVILHERRYHIPPDISINSISSHAQAEALVRRAEQDILEMPLETDSSPATGSTGRSPLSARLAAYGESLALERRLREQKDAEESHSASMDKEQSEASPSKADMFMRDGTTTNIDALPRRDGVERQHSLEHKSGRPRLKTKPKDPRRPSTAEGLSPRETNYSMSSDQTGRSHHSSRSASGIASLSPSKLSAERDIDSAESHDSFPTHSHSSLGYNRSGHLPRTRTRTPLPLPDPGNGQLSRICSVEAPDTDMELGGPLCRVSTAPLSGTPHLRGKREVKSANKLTRMGFSPAEQVGRTNPPVSGNKRFGAFKSLMQTIKGK